MMSKPQPRYFTSGEGKPNLSDYSEFLKRKSQLGGNHGFSPVWMPDFLFDFQAALVEWALLKGRAAIFADCGLGKTPMQLVWAENVVRRTGKPVLVLTPLAVGQQTILEAAKFGITAVRSRDGSAPSTGIAVTNYEKLHLFAPGDFAGVVCDESSILKHFTGATQKAVTRFMAKLPYRLLCTATAAPNDYIELGTSSEALGELGHSEMLTRFFSQSEAKPCRIEDVKRSLKAKHFAKLSFRASQTIEQWHLKPHAEEHFWRWVCSWARACRKPSDLGFSDASFVLPALQEREHTVKAKTLPPGVLFPRVAVGLQEEREERRRTMQERCEHVARLVEGHDYSMIWCHLNTEGDLLERTIPYSVQVSGSDSEDYKEMAVEWFRGDKCICNEPLFRAKLATWRNGSRDTGSGITTSIENSAWQSRSATPKSIETANESTCASTTELTKVSGSARASSKTTSTLGVVNATPQTVESARRQSLPLRTIDGATQTSGSSDNSPNTASLSPTITRLSRAAVPSVVEAPTLTSGDSSGSTSTTATRPSASGDSSVHPATLGSASSKTTPRSLNAPRCICGHLHGPRRLISKPRIFGWGLNLQHCAHVVTFASHSYEQYYQSVRRCWRFGQTRPVVVDVVSTEGEAGVRENMLRKGEAAVRMFASLVTHMNQSTRIERPVGTQEVEVPRWAYATK